MYERPLPAPEPQSQSGKWTAHIDPKTKLPLASSFGERVYEFGNLEIDLEIPDSIFAIPENVRGTWEIQAREQAHQDKLRQINARKR